MKKKLLAAVVGAALVAPVSAMADYGNFNISGNIRVSLNNHKLDRAGTSSSGELRLDDQISDITLSGATDEIGGGVKAFFHIESRIAADIGTASALQGWGFGNVGVGLQGDFGKVTLGRWNLHYTELLPLDGTASGDVGNWHSIGVLAMVQGAAGGAASYIARGSRSDNAVMYDSPNVNGFTGTAAYSFNPQGNEGSGVGATDGGEGGAYNLAVRWRSKEMFAGVSLWDREIEGAATDLGDEESMRAWFQYSFPFGLAVGAALDRSGRRFTNGGSMTERDGVLLAVNYKMGSNIFHARYSKLDDSETGGTTHTDTGATSYSFGYDYALSKRTFVGVSYAQIDNDANAAYNVYGGHLQAAGLNTVSGTGATVGGDDISILALTMRHVF